MNENPLLKGKLLPEIKNNTKGLRYQLNLRHQKYILSYLRINQLISVVGETKELIRGSKINLQHWRRVTSWFILFWVYFCFIYWLRSTLRLCFGWSIEICFDIILMMNAMKIGMKPKGTTETLNRERYKQQYTRFIENEFTYNTHVLLKQIC